MNWGYPFRFSQPYQPATAEQVIIDAVIERFQGVRRENHEQQTLEARPLQLSPCEASALIGVLEACLVECRGNSISIHLHLHAEDEDEVRGLIGRLRAWTPEPQPAVHHPLRDRGCAGGGDGQFDRPVSE
jgi:hypothetical protein